MAKAPAFQFYPDDFLRDTLELSLAARGAWITLLCKMWHSVTPGRLSMSMAGYARMFGSTVDQAQAVVDELTSFQICDADRESHANVTLTNRRMFRDWEEREAARLRAKNYRDRNREGPEDVGVTQSSRPRHGNVTAYSSSSSPTSSSDDIKRLIDRVRACEANSEFDPRLVEIAVIETLMRRKGSSNEHRPIKSVRYFDEEIRTMVEKGGGLSSKAINSMLQRRREQAGLLNGTKNGK